MESHELKHLFQIHVLLCLKHSPQLVLDRPPAHGREVSHKPPRRHGEAHDYS